MWQKRSHCFSDMGGQTKPYFNTTYNHNRHSRVCFQFQINFLSFGTGSPQSLNMDQISHFLAPGKIWEGVSESKERSTIAAPAGCFRSPICCSVLKLEHFKGDFGQKLRPNFARFHPHLKIRGGVSSTSE